MNSNTNTTDNSMMFDDIQDFIRFSNLLGFGYDESHDAEEVEDENELIDFDIENQDKDFELEELEEFEELIEEDFELEDEETDEEEEDEEEDEDADEDEGVVEPAPAIAIDIAEQKRIAFNNAFYKIVAEVLAEEDDDDYEQPNKKIKIHDFNINDYDLNEVVDYIADNVVDNIANNVAHDASSDAVSDTSSDASSETDFNSYCELSWENFVARTTDFAIREQALRFPNSLPMYYVPSDERMQRYSNINC